MKTNTAALFDIGDVAPVTRPGLIADELGNCYAAHLFQHSAPAMWKLGYTEASPLKRAKQIACTPVAWWTGSLRDERQMHRMWKHHRVSPAAEFFWQDGDELDRYVLQHIKRMPSTLIAMRLEVFAAIELRWHEEQGSGLSNRLLMDLLTALSGQKRTRGGETTRQALEQIFYDQLRARKQLRSALPPAA